MLKRDMVNFTASRIALANLNTRHVYMKKEKNGTEIAGGKLAFSAPRSRSALAFIYPRPDGWSWRDHFAPAGFREYHKRISAPPYLAHLFIHIFSTFHDNGAQVISGHVNRLGQVTSTPKHL